LAINALRTLALARSLAEPNLTTLNGQPASFQAGGQFPVPVVAGSAGGGLQGVAYVPFGVQLQFTPYIVARNHIRLVVQAKVSTRNAALGSTIGGTNVPGLDSRDFQGTVELLDGQTLAVAGLIQTNFGANSDRVPLWGDLPIIGRTGANDRVSSGEQELVILITPCLVHPLDKHELPPLPGQDVFEPNDVEFYLCGKLESNRGCDFRAAARTDWCRLRRGHNCQDPFLIGPSGYCYGCASAAPGP
jgi:pilus assembly protein CpaC